MKFVCIGFINEAEWNAIPVDKQELLLAEYENYHNYLRSAGKFIGGIGLKETWHGSRLSYRAGTVLRQKIPADAESIGGIFIIEAVSLTEAEVIVRNHPGLKVGSVEIRLADDQLTEHVGLIKLK